MAIDDQIALNAGGTNALAQNNGVAQFGQFANALAAGTQAKRAMLGFQGAQALGQAYATNRNPDGSINYQGVTSDLASSPAGSYVLPQAVAEGQSQQKSQYQLNADQLAQVQARTNAFNQALTPLMRLGSAVTPHDVASTIAGLASSGVPVGEFAADAAQTMPVLDPSQANDPQAQAAYGKQLQGWIFNHAGRAWPASVGVDMTTPHPTVQDTGGGVRVFDSNPYTNPDLLNGGEDVNKTLSPGEQADQVTLRDASGNSYTVPRATVAGMQGQGNLVPPGMAPNTAASPFGSGRYAPSGGAASAPAQPPAADPFSGGGANAQADGSASQPQQPPATASTPAPSAFGGGSGLPPGALRTGVGPATTVALNAQGQEAGSEAANLTSSAQDIPQRKAMLSDMEADLQNAPTGPGAQNQAFWSAFANNHLGPLAKLIPGVEDPGQVATFENFEKVAGKFAQAQSQSLGTVTNDKLGAAMSSNPNTVFSTLGNAGVIHILQGNEDALNVKNQAWNNYLSSGGDPAKYQQWSSAFNNSGFDPKTFWMKNMTPPERSAFIGALSPSQASTFYNNIRTGIANGWVKPSDFAASPTPAQAPSAPVANPANGY